MPKTLGIQSHSWRTGGTHSAGPPVARSVVLIRKYGVAVVLAVRADNLWAAVLGRERPFVTFKTSQVQTLQPPSIGTYGVQMCG